MASHRCYRHEKRSLYQVCALIHCFHLFIPPLIQTNPIKPVIRSLWDGFNNQGATEDLLRLLDTCILTCPSLGIDYKLLHWISNKRYLLRLQDVHGVRTVPTLLVEQQSSPGQIKRLMESNGWQEAVLKPVVGSRGRFVTRLSLRKWDLTSTNTIVQLIARGGDYLLQPCLPPVFFPGVHCDNNYHHLEDSFNPTVDASVGNCVHGIGDKIMVPASLGECCLLFLNGSIIHAVHKDPKIWGWHLPSCPCSKSFDELTPYSTCSCGAGGVECDQIYSSPPLVITGRGTPSTVPEDVRNRLERAPVQPLQLPLPTSLSCTAQEAVEAFLREVSTSGEDRDIPVLCRVDLLPIVNAVGNLLEWRVSELEGIWAEYFLRAAPSSVCRQIAEAIVRQIDVNDVDGSKNNVKANCN